MDFSSYFADLIYNGTGIVRIACTSITVQHGLKYKLSIDVKVSAQTGGWRLYTDNGWYWNNTTKEWQDSFKSNAIVNTSWETVEVELPAMPRNSKKVIVYISRATLSQSYSIFDDNA